MRTDLPPAIASAIERCDGPTLLFDRARLVSNMRALVDAAHAAGIVALFAAKSFPHPDVWAMAADVFDGFDAASAGEALALPHVRTLSIVDPSGRGAASARAAARLIVGCETALQVRAAPPHADIAIRISASVTGRDPAIGAVLDGSGHRRSRFGLDAPEQLAELVAAAGTRRVGVHVHHGPVTATSATRYLASARAVLDVAASAGLAPAFLDLGGAWHGIADLRAAFAEVRAAIPDLELIVEPGRAVVEGAGFACGHVVVARELADRPLRVLDLSRICHLRWSQVELVGAAPRPGAGRTTLFVGPTCFEEDVVGEWTIDPARYEPGRAVVLRNVTGYAVAWNGSFGGIAPAAVALV